jgi:hypothetical protein
MSQKQGRTSKTKHTIQNRHPTKPTFTKTRVEHKGGSQNLNWSEIHKYIEKMFDILTEVIIGNN